MIYYDKTWWLPQRASLSNPRPHPQHFHASLNPFACLAQGVPDADDNRDDDNMASPLLDASEHSDLSEVEQRRFEIRLNRQSACKMLQLVSDQPLSRIFNTSEIFYGPQQSLREKSQRITNVFHRFLQELFARLLFLLAAASLAHCQRST